jgi:4,5-DOPA dioxygenase extradiol
MKKNLTVIKRKVVRRNIKMNIKTKMPLLFLGHGSPMNAIAENNFTQTLSKIKNLIETPKAILMISAHWTTEDTRITAAAHPPTIHDFNGFPKPLFDIQYQSPGNPELARSIIKELASSHVKVEADLEWGLDHGTWSILRHIFPDANIPVLQLSMDMTKPSEFHFELGSKLKYLREQGVLIIGSGNIVHNLRQIDWNEAAKPLEWAVEFDQWVKEKIEQHDFNSLVHDFTKSKSGQLSNPTLEHYFPMLYILGAVDETDHCSTLFEGFQNASISMRSLMWN